MDDICLVVGAGGIVGEALVEHLERHTNWTILALRRSNKKSVKTNPTRIIPISVDLFDLPSLVKALSPYKIAYVFYAAQDPQVARSNSHKQASLKTLRLQLKIGALVVGIFKNPNSFVLKNFYKEIAIKAGLGDPKQKNHLMFKNLLTAIDPVGLKHLCVISGGRYYGQHMGPGLYPEYKTPFAEDDPPCPGPSWYQDVALHLKDFVQDRSLSWSVLRPSFIIGIAPGSFFDLGMGIAVYAAIQKELGEPLRFWGDSEAFHCRQSLTYAYDLAKMAHWAASTPDFVSGSYNCTAADSYSFAEIWPKIADIFQVTVDKELKPFSMAEWVKGKEAVWKSMVAKYNLAPYNLTEILSGAFLDLAVIPNWDVVFSMAKAKKAGFALREKSEDVFTIFFQRLKKERFIP